MMLADCYQAQRVRARCAIHDSPLAVVDASAHRGEIGYVDDVDSAGELVMVDFGRGSIACTPDELEHTYGHGY